MKVTSSKNLDSMWSPVKLSEAQKAALAKGEFVVIATQVGYSAPTLRKLNGTAK